MSNQIETTLKTFFRDKTILVTGGTGSIGRQIVNKLTSCSPKKVIVFSKDDSKQYMMKNEYADHPEVVFALGDVRDASRVRQLVKGVDIIFHAAALKQVPTCEDNPFEAVQTNIIGGQHVIEAALEHEVSHVVNISTDKAVSPTNAMGATKLISEKLFSQANESIPNQKTKFCSVRFGNVLGSRGSVIPIMLQQLLNEKPLTVTDPHMTRFFMSIEEAVSLTLQAAIMMKGGETFILKMESLQLADLLKAFHEYAAQINAKSPEILVVGKRPGEKLHEELTFPHEADALFEHEQFYAILPRPHLHPAFQKVDLTNYTSKEAPLITKEKLFTIIEQLHHTHHKK
ncbi:SDR family NAD(P)-dependent oxidoreductase [Bacillus safensis]|uniref:SDR family NAD(P)-dependent oxidoreductase n=1 Tax=Bacillus TaxID=1386 RepID=UPI000BD5F62E|nr:MULTISPECIES: SDR family NAD(P)-dependent oxidoreductase [Bacillus]MBU5207440.1 SDR family NAD(P)-dependent oxidoreductase [Bacillus safensis]MED1575967.1 SDR family NAD(P)-dependent oxidoreductase [Bacillus safensis]MEE3677036.1 SDR family NAD(P)-dependent oxidoreductase [Bacillus safensis]PCK12014.1 capsule biosynthesis protein CapD [Bacillus safensis]RUK49547.1 polysaccharide biosynthesis protein [Bacillus safensis]